jgi:hypothetical protein
MEWTLAAIFFVRGLGEPRLSMPEDWLGSSKPWVVFRSELEAVPEWRGRLSVATSFFRVR